jgi:hypothetical protein
MRLALTQPALAVALCARGLARAAQFTRERTARETMAVNGADSVGDRPERYFSGQASTPRPILELLGRRQDDWPVGWRWV